MSKSTRPYLVEVTWTDSFTHDLGWGPVSEYLLQVSSTPFLIRSVGFLLRADRRRIVLSPSLDPMGKCSGVWVIPRGVVKKIRRLK